MESETLKTYKEETKAKNEADLQAEATSRMFEALNLCVDKTNFVKTSVIISSCAYPAVIKSDEDKLRFKIKLEDIKTASESLLKTTTDLLQSISTPKKEGN